MEEFRQRIRTDFIASPATVRYVYSLAVRIHTKKAIAERTHTHIYIHARICGGHHFVVFFGFFWGIIVRARNTGDRKQKASAVLGCIIRIRNQGLSILLSFCFLPTFLYAFPCYYKYFHGFFYILLKWSEEQMELKQKEADNRDKERHRHKVSSWFSCLFFCAGPVSLPPLPSFLSPLHATPSANLGVKVSHGINRMKSTNIQQVNLRNGKQKQTIAQLNPVCLKSDKHTHTHTPTNLHTVTNIDKAVINAVCSSRESRGPRAQADTTLLAISPFNCLRNYCRGA